MKTIQHNTLRFSFKNALYILALVLGLTFTACNSEDEVNLEAEAELATDEADIEGAMEDIDDLVAVSIDALAEADAEAGRVYEEEPDDDRMCQGVFSIEGTRQEGTITLDFGDGCIDAKGNKRKGKIIITYENGPKFQAGFKATTTLENYSINDIKIEGTRVLTNISESTVGRPAFNVVLTGGKVTWPDETTATRTSDKTWVWVRGNISANDEIRVIGTAEGINRRGVAYDMEITDSLVHRRACRFLRRIKMPVAGVKVITTENHVITVYYGDGECDRKVRIVVDGESDDVIIE